MSIEDGAMEHFLKSAPLSGVRHEVLLEKGYVADKFCQAVDDRQIDLVVIGIPRQQFRTFWADSMLEKILDEIGCPVLIVRSHTVQKEPANDRFQRILYVTDLTANSLYGLPYALAFARDNRAELDFVHLVDCLRTPGFYHGSPQDFAFRRYLGNVVCETGDQLKQREFIVAYGNPTEGVARVAANENAGLIVIGGGSLSAMAMGSLSRTLASQVVWHAHCPVLLIQIPWLKPQITTSERSQTSA